LEANKYILRDFGRIGPQWGKWRNWTAKDNDDDDDGDDDDDDGGDDGGDINK
jgi:hypothetical protein